MAQGQHCQLPSLTLFYIMVCFKERFISGQKIVHSRTIDWQTWWQIFSFYPSLEDKPKSNIKLSYLFLLFAEIFAIKRYYEPCGPGRTGKLCIYETEELILCIRYFFLNEKINERQNNNTITKNRSMRTNDSNNS